MTFTPQTPTQPDAISVLALLPFWRYAVGPASLRTPAIPFYRRSSALAFFEEARRELPFSGVTLYRRRGFGHFDVEKEYTP